MKTPQKMSRGAALFMFLFALPFACVGVGATFLVARTVLGAFEMRHWVASPAVIEFTQLHSHRNSDGATTKRLEARYRYEYEGATHSGDRVSLHSGSDNIGSYQKRMYAQLQKKRREGGQGFLVFVNPKNPSQSIIDRNPRIEMLAFYSLFAVTFGAVGFGLMFLVFKGSRKINQEVQLATHFPNEPWRWRQEWGQGRIRSTHKSKMIAIGIFAFFWNLISSPVLFFLPEEIFQKKNYGVLVALLFPAIGLGLLFYLLRLLLQWRRFGETTLHLDTFPGVIGGALKGTLETRFFPGAHPLRIHLANVHRVTSGSGKNRSTRESILWEKTLTLAGDQLPIDQHGVRIPIEFAIPSTCTPTEGLDSSDEILWRLDVNADIPGVDFSFQFHVPVFRTAESREGVTSEMSQTPAYAIQPSMDQMLEAEKIQKHVINDGVTYRVPMLRKVGPAFSLTFFVALWTGIFVAILKFKAPMIFAVVWGAIEFFLVLFWFDLLFWRASIVFQPTCVAFKSGIFGLGPRHVYPKGSIQEFKLTTDMSSGNKQYYRVVAISKDSRPRPFVKFISNRETAESLIVEFKQFL